MTNESGMAIGVDVGGTKVIAGVVGERGETLSIAHRGTPGRSVDARHLEDTVVEVVQEVSGGRPLLGVGIAAAGFVDVTRERVMFAPHLPWRGEPVRERLQERLSAPVVLDNDANCAALAEATYGAGQGADPMLMITLGTGIGGAVVLRGEVMRGAHGMAGEFGHMRVVPDGRPCQCGRSGCWEQYCSGNALERYVRSRIGVDSTVLVDACDGNPDALTGPMVTAAADEGDLVAREAFRVVGEQLGLGVANLVAALDPEVVVVGGGLSAAGDRLVEPARIALARSLVGSGHRVVPPLVVAGLGPEAGVVGAAELVRQRVAQARR